MLIYEITAIVSDELIENYEKYMREQHIPDLLQTGHFVQAYFTRSGENRYRIQYFAHDQKSLDDYLQKTHRICAKILIKTFLKELKSRGRIGRF
ncbi:MAG: DUF4286 family protein [Blastocatellia bacterium]|nr:DUF4286 family protein [Blastocatellia bacterium]